MTYRYLFALLSSLAFVPLASAAAPVRVVTVPFDGPRASIPRDQIVRVLCQEVTCVSQRRVTTRRGDPDWRKMRRNGVDFVVAAQVKGRTGRRRITLVALDARGRRKFRKTWPLARNGKLSRSDLREATSKLLEVMAPAPPSPPPPREERVEREERREEPERREEEVARAEPPVEEEEGYGLRQLPERSDLAEEEESSRLEAGPPPPLIRRDRPLLVAEAGADFVHRSLAYSDLRVPNLRSYETRPFLFAPRLRLEVYPLARIMSGLAQGVGLELDYLYAVGLRSIDENGLAHPTTVSRFDLAARMNFWPLEDRKLMVAPVLGYRAAKFAVGEAEDGTRLAGLPTITYGALRVGAEAELPFGPVTPFARLSWVQALSLGEIASDAFFPGAGASAVEAAVGAGYGVWKDLSLRAALHYTRYGLRFSPAEDATYQASGAVDQYLGMVVSARYTY